ncbi:MerR family DNA-binding transcriptional regulator [Streptomyces sp. NPDC020817]|uniref:helix-turn-helix domain-containing protein n=1 Tax=Streptomyces sp. NPDC020817 TaxID=3365095 RepID=UPI00379E74B0
MDWPIAEVARMSGVTARTLRHDDETGLLPPAPPRGTGPARRPGRHRLPHDRRTGAVQEDGNPMPSTGRRTSSRA